MPATDPTTTIRTLVAAIPNDRLIDLLLDLLSRALPARAAAAPAPEPEAPVAPRRRRGRPRRRRKKANRNGTTAGRVAAAAYARQKRANGNTNDRNGSVTAFWGHAAKLEPARPWAAVMREFDIKEPVARNCYDKQRLPPRIGPMPIERFLTLETGDAR